MTARLACAAALASCVLYTFDARADLTSIGLVGDTHGVLAERLRGELGARGFEVRALDAFEPADALPNDVSAVLRVESARRRVEVWTASGVGGSARFRTTVAARGEEIDDETIAVRAAEDVRAYLDAPAERAPAPSPVDPDGLPAAPETHARAFSLGLDAALLFPQGGPGAAAEVVARARWFAFPRVAFGVRGWVPVVAATFRSGTDSTSIATTAAGPEAYVRLVGDGADSAWDAGIAAGVVAAWVRTTGTADSPRVGRRDDAWTALPFASVELARTVAPRVRVRASLFAGIAAPTVTIRFAGTDASSWGGPLAGAALGADLDF